MCFCEDITAIAATKLVRENRKTANNYYNAIREKTLVESLKDMSVDSGEFEADESYFEARRVRGKRGRGAAGKTPVFGLLKRGGKVFVKAVENCSREELMPAIKGKVLEGSVIHTDGWKAYDGLIVNRYDHYRVFHSRDEFTRGKSYVIGIGNGNFRSFVKRRLAKFNSCASDKFVLHLKECEFRYNHRD